MCIFLLCVCVVDYGGGSHNMNDCYYLRQDFTFGMDTDDEGITIMGEIIVPAGSDAVADDALICTVLHKKEPKEEEKL